MTLQWEELLVGLTLKGPVEQHQAQNSFRNLSLSWRTWKLLFSFVFTRTPWLYSSPQSLARTPRLNIAHSRNIFASGDLTVTVGTRCLRCDFTVSTGQLPGALCPDGAVPRPCGDPSSPALGPDQLAFLGLPAPVPALPDLGQADPVRIRHDHTGHCCGLRRRLVSIDEAANWSCFFFILNQILFCDLNASLKQQMRWL